MAIIDAAARFGVDTDDSQVAEDERIAIAQALSQQEFQREQDRDTFRFYAIIAKQATAGTNILLTLKVPWEHREEVWRAMEHTMPFSAQVQMTEIEPLRR